MAEERKNPKIDLRSRIPTKTVKGKAISAPDTGGKARPQIDPNDPLGGGAVEHAPKQQIVVVQAEPTGGSHATRGAMFFVVIGLVAAAGGGLGYVGGTMSTDKGRSNSARENMKALKGKVATASSALAEYETALKSAQNDLETNGAFSKEAVDKITGFSAPFKRGDLTEMDVARFGKDRAGRLYDFVSSVDYIDRLNAQLKALEPATAADHLKATITPKDMLPAMGITLSKPGNFGSEPTIAKFVDMKEPLSLKTMLTQPAKDSKDPPKLKTKAGEYSVYPGKGDFIGDTTYISTLDPKQWKEVCPLYQMSKEHYARPIADIIAAIEGSGEGNIGALKQAEAVAKDLESATHE